MSSTFPILFKPIIEDDKCFIDGGLLNNFPINDCLENNEESEILGFDIKFPGEENKITADSTIINYLIVLLLQYLMDLKKNIYSQVKKG